MITAKTAISKVVLLSPHHLLSEPLQPLAEVLQITKSAKGIQYEAAELDDQFINKQYSALPKEARHAVSGLGKLFLQQLKQEIKKSYRQQRSGMSFEKYQKKVLLRRLHQVLKEVKTYSGQIKWYHKLPTGKGHFTTAPCRLQPATVQLQFEVVRSGQQFQLHTRVLLNGSEYELHNLKRFHFLLLQQNDYYLLPYKDFQTLEWLQHNNPQQYSEQPQELEENILSKLEPDYPVNRNNLFTKNEIKEIPVNRVLLSEISQSFLVLTPQWDYEGVIIEGPFQETQEVTRQGKPYTVHRHRATETAFNQLLESLHPNFSRQLNGYYYLNFAEAQKKQWFRNVYHKLLDLDIQFVGMDMLQHFRFSPHKIATEVTINSDNDTAVTLHMRVHFGNEEIALADLQKTVRAGGKALMLDDGSLGLLTNEWLQQYGTIIRHGKIIGKALQVARWLAFSEQEADDATQVLKPVIHQHWWQLWQQWQAGPAILFPVPQQVQATLRPYQQKGFEWMVLLQQAGAGACLADDMGLGKTLQTICFLAYRLQQPAAGCHLVVCPSSLLYNWQQELQQFAPHLQAVVYHGAGRSLQQAQETGAQIIITSYGTLRQDTEQLAALFFDTVVLDESHHIKNPSAQVTQAVNRLQTGFGIALSGTPVINNTFDLYAQFNFLLPALFVSRDFFKREYADAIDSRKDSYKIQCLQKLVAPFVLRRTKDQVAKDLPPKTEMVLWCEMGAAQQEQYNTIKEQIRSSLFLEIKNEGLNKSRLAVIQGILKLRQVCNSPLLLPAEERTCHDSVKTALLIEELTNNLAGQKTLVFSQFSSMLHLLADSLRKEGISFYHFDGQTAPDKRMEMVNRFSEPGNDTHLFLISLKAGNTGLNLTAAGYVFLFDPWWNTAVQQQAIDRTHRIGQTKNVFAYKMICRDTIEEKIIHLQQQKKQLADSLITEDEGFVKSLTEQDIEYLFS